MPRVQIDLRGLEPVIFQSFDNQAVAMPQETVSQFGERARVRRPLKGYKYTIING